MECLAAGLGGFVGTVCRYLIGLIPLKETWIFPVKTFLINIAGCFFIGVISALALKGTHVSPRLMLFLKVGVCGGFTTFSSFALESGDLIKNGNAAAAVIYIVLSILLGVAAVFAGQKI